MSQYLINDVNDRQGLVGYLGGFTFDPDMDAGFVRTNSSELIPKLLRASVEFTVLHTHKLGWHRGAPRVDRFPYNKGFFRDNSAAAALASTQKVANAEAEETSADKLQEAAREQGISMAAAQHQREQAQARLDAQHERDQAAALKDEEDIKQSLQNRAMNQALQEGKTYGRKGKKTKSTDSGGLVGDAFGE